jgi:predicted dehydrogenase
MSSRLRTVLVGAGRIGAGYSDDPVMARYFRYATHAQVLVDHPAFEWGAVVDPSEETLARVRERFSVPRAARTPEALPRDWAPDVAILATPPEGRLEALAQMPSVRAVLVEKPLGASTAEAEAFLSHCRARGILVQVNLWRRADEALRALKDGGLSARIGAAQGGFSVYGNGLRNNGTHMVDQVRMLLGEVERAQALGGVAPWRAGPLQGDVHVPFALALAGGQVVSFCPLDFAQYRENSLDLWGTEGRLSIYQEGLGIASYPRRDNRAMSGEREVASDAPSEITPTAGEAFFRMFTNLADAMEGRAELWSDGRSALRTAAVIEAIERSAAEGGALIELGSWA